jgi:protein-tyrosine phosphatase
VASILVVCTGNVCRSPIAEVALRTKLTDRFGDRAPVVSSAGTAGWEGSGAVWESVKVAAERGFDIDAHVAQELTPAMVEEADLIVCMAAEHRDAVRSSSDDALPRTFTLKGLVTLLEQLPPVPAGADPDSLTARVAEAAAIAGPPNGSGEFVDEDVADPLGSSMEAFRAIAWEIDDRTDALVVGLYGPVPAHS